jgi:hypothetical protein
LRQGKTKSFIASTKAEWCEKSFLRTELHRDFTPPPPPKKNLQKTLLCRQQLAPEANQIGQHFQV